MHSQHPSPQSPMEGLRVDQRLGRMLRAIVLPLAISLSGAAAPVDLPANSLPTTMEALTHPGLDTEGKEFKDWTFTQGHSTYTLSGQAAYIRAGGKPVGFFFSGKGQFRYVSALALEHPSLHYNVKAHSYAKVTPCPEGVAITQRVDDGLFWFAGSTAPELPGTPVKMKDKGFHSALAVFQEKDLNGFLHHIALRWIGSTSTPYFKAQLCCGLNPRHFTHEIDALDSEQLKVAKFRHADQPFATTWVQLSRQMEGWSYQSPKTPQFALTNVHIDLKAPKSGLASLSVEETLLPVAKGLKGFDLDLYNFRAEYDDIKGWVSRPMNVISVRDAQGHPLPFDHREHRILVAVPNLEQHVPVTLTFEIQGAVVPERVLRQSWWALDRGPWFPLPTEWSARAFTVQARAQVADPYIPIMSGETLRRTRENGVTTLETRLDKPSQNFGIYAGNWDIQEATCNGITVRVVGTSGITMDRTTYRSSFAHIETFLKYFEQVMGPFPFKEINNITWGRPSASPTILGGSDTKPFPDPGSEPSFPSGYGLGFAELIARQYWGQMVQPWSLEDAWLTEGFSEYLARGAMLGIPTMGPKWFEVQKNHWSLSSVRAADVSSLPLANTLELGTGARVEAYYPTILLCHKGALLLDAIHGQLGDKDFAAFLKDYSSTMAWRRNMVAEIPSFIQTTYGKDITPIMNRYYWGMEIPPKSATVPQETRNAQLTANPR